MARKGPAPFKRGGLHRLECPDCPCYGYFTVAMLEDAGLPGCFRAGCGATMMPAELELAFLLGADNAPVVEEWRRRTANSELAQCRSLGWERAAERHAAGTLNRMDAKHADEMRQERRLMARERRLAALRPVPLSSDPIPF
jgi:hypothetical protein